jgi:allophanate hydrolase
MSYRSLAIKDLHDAYRLGTSSPKQMIDDVLARIGSDSHRAWITVLDADALHRYIAALEQRPRDSMPLYGVPFAIKDNIDLAGVATTAGCPDYAYTPVESAHVVQRLIDAGAIPIGKTNLDQFATGLNGTRSPYGVCQNAFDRRYVSGGSSAGSAVSVALGQVSFALGTDTAGSGRVPAAFNHLVGLKPTRGLLSTSGVVPACRTLDAVSIMALTAADAHQVFASALGFDANDAYARPVEPHGIDLATLAQLRIGVPRVSQQIFFGDEGYRDSFQAAIEHARQLGAAVIEIDFEPFLETARLLYQGPWISERYQAIRYFIDSQPESVFPVTREITLGGATPLAADAFAAMYRLKALARQTTSVWRDIDMLLMPTAPCHPTIDAVLEAPIERNSELGVYTNFVNLLDYAAVAIPFNFVNGLPFGVTIAAPAHQDVPLLRYAERCQHSLEGRAATLGATGIDIGTHVVPDAAVPTGQVLLAVCGAHMSGQPLNGELLSRGAHLVGASATAPSYRLYALAQQGGAARPGLVRADKDGRSIAVELWEIPAREFGSFVAEIPAPLGIGTTLLADGRAVPGFICESAGLSGATDISDWGGWRAWRASLP